MLQSLPSPNDTDANASGAPTGTCGTMTTTRAGLTKVFGSVTEAKAGLTQACGTVAKAKAGLTQACGSVARARAGLTRAYGSVTQQVITYSWCVGRKAYKSATQRCFIAAL